MAAILFAACVVILAVGWLWFHIVRPILEDFGIIIDADSVNDNEEAPAPLMSRSVDILPPSAPLSLQTDSRQTADKGASALPSRDVMLDTYKLLRKYGIPREEARPVLKAAGLSLDNNLWTDAAPHEPPHITPIVGRPTAAQFDPDYPYKPLEA